MENEEKDQLNSGFTPEEQAAKSFLDWSDESLGRMVRKTVAHLANYDDNGKGVVTGTSAAYMLIDAARRANAEKLTVTIEGHSQRGVSTGDWKIIVKKVKRK